MAQQLTVTLPDEIAARVRQRVADGQYPDESAVIEDGLRALDDEWDPTGEPEFEAFLRREVMRSIEEADREPNSLMTVDQVRESLGLRRGVNDRRQTFGGEG